MLLISSCVSVSVLWSISLLLSVNGLGDVDLNSNCSMRENFSCNLLNLTLGECNPFTGECSCTDTELGDCFELNSTINYCVEAQSDCNSYQAEDGICRRGRRRRTVALLLSIFLINFGAANFYIEQYELAIPQIILGLALCLFQFGSCAVAGTRDGDTSVPCIICCSINSFVSLLFLSWWIADLIIFATNMRSDGLGCPLY